MKQKLLKLTLAFAVILVLFISTKTVNAASYEYKINYGDNTATITGWDTSATGSITIPSEINGYPVTTIGARAFYYCSKLTTITIPDSVTSIGEGAFYGCSKLTTITIPDSVTTIGEDAFYGCSGLTTITIPDSVTSIGSYAFGNCSGLTSINVSDNNASYSTLDGNLYNKTQTSLIQYAIRKSETSFTIPDSVTTIGSYAFEYCSYLRLVTISDGVESIGNGAFRECTGLSRLIIPDSVTYIGDEAFYGCTGITKIKLSQNLTNIGKYAFTVSTSLTSITIPDSVTTIGLGAFGGCSGITEINIPSSIQSIGSNAFPYGLKKAYVDKDLEQLPKRTFVDYASLEVVVFYGKQTKISIEDFWGCSNVVISGYPGSYAETYANDNLFDFIPLDVTETTVTATSYAGNDTIIIYANISEQVDDECLHIALYNSNNTLVDYIIIPPNKPFDSMNVAFKDDDNAAYAKVFLWKNMISAQPIADAVRVDIYR